MLIFQITPVVSSFIHFHQGRPWCLCMNLLEMSNDMKPKAVGSWHLYHIMLTSMPSTHRYHTDINSLMSINMLWTCPSAPVSTCAWHTAPHCATPCCPWMPQSSQRRAIVPEPNAAEHKFSFSCHCCSRLDSPLLAVQRASSDKAEVSLNKSVRGVGVNRGHGRESSIACYVTQDALRVSACRCQPSQWLRSCSNLAAFL